MRVSSHETWPFLFRKRIKKIDLKTVSVGTILWQPPPGVEIMIVQAFVRGRERVHTGGSLTSPTITIDNGTGAQNIVANVALAGIVVGTVVRLAVIGNHVIDNDRPLRLLLPVASDTSGVHSIDLFFAGMKLIG